MPTTLTTFTTRWIQASDKWGGAIELSILSAHYHCEIAAYDIRTKRCDVYGSDAGKAPLVLLPICMYFLDRTQHVFRHMLLVYFVFPPH